MTTEPTDAELGWLAKDCGIGWAAGLGGMDAFLRAFASAVLQRWGQPSGAGEPLSIQEIEQLLAQWNYEIHGDRARYIVRMTEQHHGIKGGQHGAP